MPTGHERPQHGHATARTATVLRLLRVSLHTAFAVLLAIAALRLFLVPDTTPGLAWTALAGSVVLAGVYAAGPLTQPRWPTHRMALGWLAAVTAVWAVLLLLSPDFSWVAFPLFFLHLHLLERGHAILAVTVVTGAVVAAQALHAQSFTVAMLLGPMLGAVFAVVIALGYAALYTESEQRRQLIDDLRRTRNELAESQHNAGMLAERERLAREIHDTLAQGLSSIVLLLRSAESTLPGDPESAGSRVAEAHQAASDNLAEARRFVRDLAPPALTGQTLVEALGRLCERTSHESGIDCRFRVDGEPGSLPSSYDVVLLRAAQASLANVTAHAGAGTVVVTLAFLDTEVTLDIYDDGVGFDPSAEPTAPDGTGFGLPTLRKRVAAVGGRVAVESAPGEGTVVAIGLPLTEREDA